jgi:molecular chaperone HscB
VLIDDLPAPGADHFTLLGFPQRFDVDADELERRYLALASKVHPDRFAREGAADRRRAMEASAGVNEAYRTLRDPVRRAEYLCRLHGIDLDSSDPEHGAPHMGQGFLMEMIERRETLDARRAEGVIALGEYRDRIEDEMDETMRRAVEQLAAGEVRKAAHTLVERRYLQRLIDEIDEAV